MNDLCLIGITNGRVPFGPAGRDRFKFRGTRADSSFGYYFVLNRYKIKQINIISNHILI